jgi:cell wall-associated NlpC family hydrolase
MAAYDPRVTPARPDLAARHLEGKVAASRFADGDVLEVVASVASVRKLPRADAPLETQALRGERVTIYDCNEDGWCWGQLDRDGYVGWLPFDELAKPAQVPTHYVRALRTLIFPGPSIKIPPVGWLALGSHIAVAREQGEFAVVADGGYVPRRHVSPLPEKESDFAAIAQQFLGTPYLWGGKTSEGIDCSGLVQVALTLTGVPCPRDSDMQENALGSDIPVRTGLPAIKRGDLIFWPGHVAIACDETRIVHANAFHMAVTIEPLAEAVSRIAATGSDIRSIRRL